MAKDRFWRIAASPAGIAFLVVVLLVLLAPALSFIEVRALDVLLRLSPRHDASRYVEVIDTGDDPDAYADLRRCPEPPYGCEIPRMVYAQAVTRLKHWGAKVVVLDLMFSRPCPAEDAEVARAFREAGSVIVAATAKVKPGAVSLQDPISPLGEAVWGVGSPVAHQPNETVRTVPLVVCDQDSGKQYSALSLLALQRFLDTKPSDLKLGEGCRLLTADRKVPLLEGERLHLLPGNEPKAEQSGHESAAGLEVVHGDARLIPSMTSWNAVLINWCGPRGSIEPHAMTDVLALKDDAEGHRLFGGKAVIIGRRSWDEHWTAVGAMAGPEIQANALYTLISGAYLRPMSRWAFLGVVAAFAATTSFAVRRLKGPQTVIGAAFLAVVAFALSRELLVREGIWMYVFFCETGILLSWGLTSVAQSHKVTGLLQRLVPAFMGEQATRDLAEVRTRDATILYGDIRSFTTISERLGAETVLRLLQAYRSAVEHIIAEHGGAIVITPGDAILAVFWRERKRVNHPTCAVRAAREILAQLPSLSGAWEKAGVPLDLGFGVNAGPVAMGFVGRQDLEATVIGDAVNVAQRLESLTKDLGYPLVLSESVQVRLTDDVEAVYLDEVTVRNRKQPIKVYGVVGPGS